MNELKLVGWASFDSDFPTIYDDNETLIKKINLVKEELLQKGYVFGGEQHQNSFGCMPVFSDGTGLRFSMRAWGLLMANVRSEIDGIEYPYMHYYMSEGNPVLPDDGVDIEPKVTNESAIGVTIGPDKQLVEEAMAFGMSLMTTDKVIRKLMDLRLNNK